MKKSYLYLMVFLFGAGIYLNTLPNQYAYDDFSVIQGNTFTKKGFTGIFDHLFNDSFTGFTGKKNLFRGGRYRPLSLITFSIEYQFFGQMPFVNHLVNIILYGIICMLLLKVFSSLFNEKLIFKKFKDYFLCLSLMATLIFAVHPIHTEVTANIKGRDELMALLFGLLAWNSILIYADKTKLVQAFYGGLFFFLSLMSKESAIPFLILIPISLYCFRNKAVFRKTALMSTLMLFAGFLLFLIIRQTILGWNAKPSMGDNILSNSFMYAKGFSERYGTTLYTLWLYLKLLMVPHPLTIDYYPYYIPYIGFADIRALWALLLYTGLTISSLYLAYRKNPAGYGMLFYLVALFPVSNIPFIIGPFMGERFVFIPSAGIAIVIPWLLIRGTEKMKLARVLPYIFTSILILYAVKAISRNLDWKDNFTLYTKDVQISVNSAIITRGAGHELLLKAEGTKDPTDKKYFAGKAVFYLEQAAKLNKTETETFLLANAYYENGEYEKSLDMFLETLSLDKYHEKAFGDYFVSVNRLTSSALKIRYYDLLIKTVGDRYEPYYNKGLVFGKEMNLPDSSINNLIKANRIDSTKNECLSDLGVAFAIKGNFSQSVFYLEKAFRADPKNAMVRQNLTASLLRTGNNQRAKEIQATSSVAP